MLALAWAAVPAAQALPVAIASSYDRRPRQDQAHPAATAGRR
jgi:hypothetical protein